MSNEGRIILDNGGGITLQLGDYGHYYDDAEQAATDLAAWLAGSKTSDWDGHEDDAADLEPTQDQIRNGGYRVVSLDRSTDTAASLADELRPLGWGNADRLAEALAAKTTT